jgi:hypothetical protein
MRNGPKLPKEEMEVAHNRLAFVAVCELSMFAQTNTLPSMVDVGIGTTTPRFFFR